MHCPAHPKLHVHHLYLHREFALYVLTINKINGTIGLNAYMSPEPFPLNSFYIHSVKEILSVFGLQWEQLDA
jgi:hypothetical protein